MICPKCGTECAADTARCTSCGTVLVSTESGPSAAMADLPVAPKRRRLPIAALAVIPIALLLVAASVVWAMLSRKAAPLSQLLPDSSAVVVTLDAPWWWANSADMRGLPEVAKAIADAEQDAGISIEGDMLPWMGQVAIAMTGMDQRAGTPQALLCVEVRDRVKLLSSLTRLRDASVRTKKTGQWTTVNHKGVKIERGVLTEDKGAGVVAFAEVGGWIVMGFGDGEVEMCIDAWQGTRPSLAKKANWTKAIAQLPGKPVAWMGMNGDAYQQMLGQTGAGAMLPRNVMGLTGTCSAMALTDQGDGLRLEGAAVNTNPDYQKAMQDIKQNGKPLTGASIARLPKGTAFAIAIPAMGKFVELVGKQLENAGTTTPAQRQQMAQVSAVINELAAVLAPCTGECAFGLSWQKGVGLGFYLTAEAPSEQEARQAVDAFTALLKKRGAPVENNNGVSTISIPGSLPAFLPLAPCWSAKGTEFVLTTHPKWLNAEKGAKLPMPDALKNAAALVSIDMGAVTSALDDLAADGQAGLPKTVPDAFRKLAIDKLQVISWGSLPGEDGLAQSTMMATNWPWRTTLKSATEMIQAMPKQAPKLPGKAQRPTSPPMRSMPR